MTQLSEKGPQNQKMQKAYLDQLLLLNSMTTWLYTRSFHQKNTFPNISFYLLQDQESTHDVNFQKKVFLWNTLLYTLTQQCNDVVLFKQ